MRRREERRVLCLHSRRNGLNVGSGLYEYISINFAVDFFGILGINVSLQAGIQESRWDWTTGHIGCPKAWSFFDGHVDNPIQFSRLIALGVRLQATQRGDWKSTTKPAIQDWNSWAKATREGTTNGSLGWAGRFRKNVQIPRANGYDSVFYLSLYKYLDVYLVWRFTV